MHTATVQQGVSLSYFDLSYISMLHRDTTSELTAVEKYVFQSVNEWLRFLGMTAPPFAAFLSRHCQQTGGAPSVSNILKQCSLRNLVQRLGSVITLKPALSGMHEISILIFPDASRPSDYAQLSFIRGNIDWQACFWISTTCINGRRNVQSDR